MLAVNSVWFGVILLLIDAEYGYGLNINQSPQALNCLTRQELLSVMLPLSAGLGTFALQSQNVLADESQRKLEYMPALQGLDYGKVLSLIGDPTIARDVTMKISCITAENIVS